MDEIRKTNLKSTIFSLLAKSTIMENYIFLSQIIMPTNEIQCQGKIIFHWDFLVSDDHTNHWIISIIESYHIMEKLTIVAIFSPLIIMATNQTRLPALPPLPVWFVEGSCQVVLTTKKKTIPLFIQCFYSFFYILPNFRPGTDSEFKEDTYRGSLT